MDPFQWAAALGAGGAIAWLIVGVTLDVSGISDARADRRARQEREAELAAELDGNVDGQVLSFPGHDAPTHDQRTDAFVAWVERRRKAA